MLESNELTCDSVSVRDKLDIELKAQYARIGGGLIDIDYRTPAIDVHRPDGRNFHIQDTEADNLLNQVPVNVFESDYLLWSAQAW